jgi:hypothetical protein
LPPLPAIPVSTEEGGDVLRGEEEEGRQEEEVTELVRAGGSIPPAPGTHHHVAAGKGCSAFPAVVAWAA